MGFWFFGPATWSWGGGKGKQPRGRIVVFGLWLSLPLAAWNVYQNVRTPPPEPNKEFDVIEPPAEGWDVRRPRPGSSRT